MTLRRARRSVITDRKMPRQQRFVDEYLLDLNATQAGIQAADGVSQNGMRGAKCDRAIGASPDLGFRPLCVIRCWGRRCSKKSVRRYALWTWLPSGQSP